MGAALYYRPGLLDLKHGRSEQLVLVSRARRGTRPGVLVVSSGSQNGMTGSDRRA